MKIGKSGYLHADRHTEQYLAAGEAAGTGKGSCKIKSATNINKMGTYINKNQILSDIDINIIKKGAKQHGKRNDSQSE